MCLHSIRRFCFYTKIYENIKFIRRFKFEEKKKEIKKNEEQLLLNTPISKNYIPAINEKGDNNFYEKIYVEIKRKKEKHNVTDTNDKVNPSEKQKQAKHEAKRDVKRDVLNNHLVWQCEYNDEKKTDKIIPRGKVKNKSKKEEDVEETGSIGTNKKLVKNINAHGKNEKYLKVKDEYLKSKEKYLKVKDHNWKGTKSEETVKRNITMQKKSVANNSVKRVVKENTGTDQRNSEKVETVEAVETAETVEKENGKEGLTELVIKKQMNELKKETKEIYLNYKSNDKNYIFVEYEEYWSDEKINKILEQQKLQKHLKNKLFKGVMYVSPFDTSKCFVIKEEDVKSSGFLKSNYVLLYGFISRNRALNNDVIYAYTEKRKIRPIEKEELSVENKLPTEYKHELLSELSNSYSKNLTCGEEIGTEHREEKEMPSQNEEQQNEEQQDGENQNDSVNYCRVVKIVERKNVEIVGLINYLNIKEKINNKFEKKEKGVNGKRLEKSDKKNEEYNNNNDDNNKDVEKTEDKEESTFAKIQPYDARLPCFIYDSSNKFLNKILYHLKNRKLNIYVLTKLKEWNTNQVNPLGNVIAILGNEKNIYGIIYSLLHFYKVYFHLYKETDMLFLESQIRVNEKLLKTFENRKDVFFSKWKDQEKADSKTCQTFWKCYNKKLDYLKKASEENRKIEKYMIKSFLKNREIITDLNVFTIDPLNAKDLDDALSIEFIEDKIESHEKYKYRIGVHISDVSFFVLPNTYYDRLASQICNSIYLDFKVMHMLPSILSENICSLNTNSEKLVFSVFFYLNDNYNPYNVAVEELLANVEIKRCVIKSENQLNYDVVEYFIEDIYSEWKKKKYIIKNKEEEILIKGDMCLTNFVPNFENICKKNSISVKSGSDIFRVYLLSKMLKKKAKRKNIYQEKSLMFSFRGNSNNNKNKTQEIPLLIESQIQKEYNEQVEKHAVENILKKHKSIMNETNMKNVDVEIVEYKKKSHMLIEEIMILTNYLVAQKISQNNKFGILRVHQDTTEEIKKNLFKIIDPCTYNKIKKLIDIKEYSINELLSVCKKLLNDNQLSCLHYNILKYYKEANYIPLLNTENGNCKHFGLLLSKYIHFTSPIRRYIDIVIHRILNAVIEKEEIIYNYETLNRICDHCNYQKRKSDDVQIHMKNMFLNKYLIYLNNSYKKSIAKKEKEMLKDTIENSKKEFKKYFYLNKNIVSFLTDAYVQEIIITRNIKNMICLNILKENYIVLDERSNKINLTEKKTEENCNETIISYTCYVHETEKTSSYKNSCFVNKFANVNEKDEENEKNEENEKDEKNEENEENEENKKKGQNQEKDENITEYYFKPSNKKNVVENMKIKNAVVFYVPLLETEKSVSDTSLNLNFSLILLSYQNFTFLYHVEKKILFRLREGISWCFNQKMINGKRSESTSLGSAIGEEKEEEEEEEEEEEQEETEEEEKGEEKTEWKEMETDEKHLTEKKQEKKNDIFDKEGEEDRNIRLQNIFSIINELKVNVSCKELAMEDLSEFHKVYDSLYINEVFVERKKGKGGADECIENGEKYEKDKTGVQFSFSNEYDHLARFQNVSVFLIPGSQMWSLCLK